MSTTTTASPAPAASAVPLPLRRSRTYWVWLVGDTGQALGSSIQFFLVPLIVVLVTGSTAAAGTIAALGLGGRIATTLVGGVLADRHDLRRMMVLSGVMAAVVMVAMLVATRLELGIVVLAALNLLAGVRAGLLGGASDAALKQVVRPDLLPAASAANQARDAAVSMGAPPLGGVLLGIGAVPALAATAAAYLVSAVGALALRGDFRPAPVADPGPVRAEVSAGLRWLWARPELRRIMAVALLLNLGLNAAIATLLYHLATTGEDPARIGLVSTALGLGMLLGATVAGPLVQRLPSGLVATVGLSMAGLSMLALPFVPGFWPTLAVLTVSVLGAPAANAAVFSYLMHQTPRSVVGRVLSAVELVGAGATPLAPVLAGWGLATLGLRPTLLVCAVICLLAVVAVASSRALRTLPRPDAWGAAAQ
ncbi:MFS transporter [Ornithinimicrobium avium]|uniref:MFS transporter n=1 Tax=Ornithinimicrobium avium TaxID=2283195 RepID=A0A345NMQ0_9MICO|nr:MFS transporter [Ornithinimicrobium avium]AXH96308.1 MFS transporter [Ornithinimicrobium avium]